MPQPGYIALELMINKFSEFIEWLFEKKRKSELDKLNEINSTLKNQFDLTITDVVENPFETLKIRLESADSILFEDIISTLFKISTTSDKNQTFQKIKSHTKLNERIMELVLYREERHDKLSLELYNIKNSLHQMLKK